MHTHMCIYIYIYTFGFFKIYFCWRGREWLQQLELNRSEVRSQELRGIPHRYTLPKALGHPLLDHKQGAGSYQGPWDYN